MGQFIELETETDRSLKQLWNSPTYAHKNEVTPSTPSVDSYSQPVHSTQRSEIEHLGEKYRLRLLLEVCKRRLKSGGRGGGRGGLFLMGLEGRMRG